MDRVMLAGTDRVTLAGTDGVMLAVLWWGNPCLWLGLTRGELGAHPWLSIPRTSRPRPTGDL